MPVETFTDRTIFLPDLTFIEGTPFRRRIFKECIFTDCSLFGPAVVGLMGAVQLLEIRIAEDIDSVLWSIQETRTADYAGALGFEDCLFERCSFQDVGFLVSPQGERDIREALI